MFVAQRALKAVAISLIVVMTISHYPLRLVQAAGPYTYYVATNGSDSNDGLSVDKPFKTLKYAMEKLRAGDTLLVRGGEYKHGARTRLRPTTANGTASARITVKNYQNERPVIIGLVGLTVNYWTFSGINVTWNPEDTTPAGSHDHMIKFSCGSNWIWENSEVWGAYSYANILVSSDESEPPSCVVSNWVIRNNIIHDTYGGSDSTDVQNHNIYTNTELEAGPGLIERNVIYNAPRGNNVKLDGNDTTPTDGTPNTIVRYNTIYNASNYNLLIGNGSFNDKIYRNILVKSKASVRLFNLSGKDNLIYENIGFTQSLNKFCDDYTSTSTYPNCVGVLGSGNLYPQDPQFDCVNSPTCFHPQNATAKNYGRYAGGGGSLTETVNQPVSQGSGTSAGGGTSSSGSGQSSASTGTSTNASSSGGVGNGRSTAQAAKISLLVTATPTSATAGTVVTYSIRYRNVGSVSATNLKITDTLPVGTSYEPSSATAGGTLVGDMLVWSVGNVAVGATGIVSFKVRVN